MFALLVALAAAQDEPAPLGDVTAWSGKVVAQVSIQSETGGLGGEDLTPLLHVQQGDRLDPYQLRQDVILLYRVGDFVQVEAEVEPWLAWSDAGEPVEGVNLVYRVHAPPRIKRLVVHGNHGLHRREIAATIGVDSGDTWVEADPAPVERAIREAYVARGWPQAQVKVQVREDEPGLVQVDVGIEEGPPDLLTEIDVPRRDALGAAEVRAVLASAGLRGGKPVAPASLAVAREKLLQRLRKRGWYEANVAIRDVGEPGSVRLVVVVDPRRKWHIAYEGRRDSFPFGFLGIPERVDGLPSRRAVIDALALEEGVRLTRYFGDDASISLTEREKGRGFVDAAIQARVEENPGDVTLTLSGGRGRAHVRSNAVKLVGATGIRPSFVRAALRDGLPDDLRRGYGLFGIGRYRVSPEGVDEAVDALEDYYRAQGYADVAIAREAYEPRKPSGAVIPVDITLRVDTGPLVSIDQVGLDLPKEDAIPIGTVLQELVQAPFDPSRVDERARQVVAIYREAGYIGADATWSATRKSEELVDLVVSVTPGPPVYVRGLLVKGYRRTRRAVIEREIDLAPGDLIRPSVLARTRKGLYDLSVFRRVSVEPSGDEDRVKDVVVTVEESPNLFFEVGAGVATDEGIKATGRAGHRNLWGLAHRLTGYGEFGLGWTGDSFIPDTTAIEWEAGLRYEAPHIPGRDERAALDVLFNSQQQEPAWRIERSGFSPSVELRVGTRTTARIGYTLQWRRLFDIDPGLLVSGDPWLDELSVSELADPHPTLPSEARIHSGLDTSVVFDLRNDSFNPTAGGIGALSGLVTDGVISDVLFLKGEGSWTQFVPAGPLQVLLRARGGVAWVPGSAESLPIEERFQLGGTTFRGFLPDGIGPASEVSPEYVDFPDGIAPILDYQNRFSTARWVPTGGDAMAAVSAELLLPFSLVPGLSSWSSWKLAIFTDVGNVWWVSPLVQTDSMAAGDDPALRFSAGLGIRRVTPIGPIAVDLGFNPVPLLQRDESWARLHVSLGSL